MEIITMTNLLRGFFKNFTTGINFTLHLVFKVIGILAIMTVIGGFFPDLMGFMITMACSTFGVIVVALIILSKVGRK